MRNKEKRKFKLTKETIRTLNAAILEDIVGGDTGSVSCTGSDCGGCPTPTDHWPINYPG